MRVPLWKTELVYVTTSVVATVISLSVRWLHCIDNVFIIFLFLVAVPPKKAPVMTVDKRRFNTGDMIRANCSVSPSYPTPNVTWLLDDTPVSRQTFI